MHFYSGPALLGQVHRHVRALQEHLDVRRVVRVQRDADAGLDLERDPAQPDRLGQRGAQPDGHLPGHALVGRRGQQHGELVTAQPGDQIAGPHAVGQPVRHHPQQGIADRMPQRVVDLLEPVEVEQQEPGPAARPRHREQRVVGPAQQQGAVGQPGQLIVVSLVLAPHRHRGTGVDGGHRQQEQQHEQHRPAHDHRDQRRRGQQHEVDERLGGQGGPERRRDRGARMKRHRHVHQHEVDGEVGERGGRHVQQLLALGQPWRQ